MVLRFIAITCIFFIRIQNKQELSIGLGHRQPAAARAHSSFFIYSHDEECHDIRIVLIYFSVIPDPPCLPVLRLYSRFSWMPSHPSRLQMFWPVKGQVQHFVALLCSVLAPIVSITRQATTVTAHRARITTPMTSSTFFHVPFLLWWW